MNEAERVGAKRPVERADRVAVRGPRGEHDPEAEDAAVRDRRQPADPRSPRDDGRDDPAASGTAEDGVEQHQSCSSRS